MMVRSSRGAEPNIIGYQVSLGARIKLSPNAGCFMEAGYGKYIINGGWRSGYISDAK